MPELDTRLDRPMIARTRSVILRLARRLNASAARSGPGLTESEVFVLSLVARSGPISSKQIVAGEGLNPTMVSRIVRRLDDAGYVRREEAAGDRRVALLSTTDEGLQVYGDIRAQRSQSLIRAMEGLSAADVDRIARALPALEKLSEALHVSLTGDAPADDSRT